MKETEGANNDSKEKRLSQDAIHKAKIDEVKGLLTMLDSRKLNIVCRFIKTLLR